MRKFLHQENAGQNRIFQGISKGTPEFQNYNSSWKFSEFPRVIL
jgi:hypothetical protein